MYFLEYFYVMKYYLELDDTDSDTQLCNRLQVYCVFL